MGKENSDLVRCYSYVSIFNEKNSLTIAQRIGDHERIGKVIEHFTKSFYLFFQLIKISIVCDHFRHFYQTHPKTTKKKANIIQHLRILSLLLPVLNTCTQDTC